MWVRGSGGWLDRDDSASTTAYGRNYNFNLDRELETIDFQMGIDFGKKDFFSQGDAPIGPRGGLRPQQFVLAECSIDGSPRPPCC